MLIQPICQRGRFDAAPLPKLAVETMNFLSPTSDHRRLPLQSSGLDSQLQKVLTKLTAGLCFML
jgi:hypothetical protein